MQKPKPAASFNQDYLTSVKKEDFLKSHEHLGHLPLADIWDAAQGKTVVAKEPAQEVSKNTSKK